MPDESVQDAAQTQQPTQQQAAQMTLQQAQAVLAAAQHQRLPAAATAAPVVRMGQQPLSFKATLERPSDSNYQFYRQMKKNELLRYSQRELEDMLRYQQRSAAPVDESGGQLTKEIISTLYSPQMPSAVQKNILGSASGSGLSDGSSLIRQDLETIVDA